MPEVYVSTDVESDGPIPGPHSMLSFASAAFLPDKTLVDTFTANLKMLPEASPDPATMSWWQQHSDKWAATRTDLQDHEMAMRQYVAWIQTIPGRPMFVA